MIGSTVSHYRILDRLGGGGMGDVYKAVDLKLDRPVALKFLAGQRGAPEEAKRRFLREARASSALDHPNICTVHEIDETADGALFIAMALCEGETLRERIVRGPLDFPEAVGIAEQIAAGLTAAHERGIVHRDVKPGNVMVAPDGRVKIVDFGLAKLADQSRITHVGTVMGTMVYMSPEQIRGEATDPRTDVWSLGVVIYEMVTGRPPFDGASATEVVRAILNRSPGPMAMLRPGVPPALEGVVARALAKPPEARYAGMGALRAELLSLAAAPARTPPSQSTTLLDLPLSPLPAGPAAAEEWLGQRVDHFEILELLGGGGMGVVYKARDTRLARIVALKFLAPELTRDPRSRERFEQEARAASSLDHPNLCTILELGDAPDGRLYIAMPFYGGETLRRKIERGPLSVEEVLDVAAQTARGLAKAHRNGIIHRDIKPANLIVTGDGMVKILDFGLARLAGQAVSRTGSVAGTPAYMSPEQLGGDEVDARTDLWSLGVVLYEMLAGRRPFQGERAQTVIYSILHERAQPLRELRPKVPPELARIVERLLAKEPDGRYPSIDEPLAWLLSLAGKTGTMGLSTVRPSRRQTAVRAGGALAAVVALIAGTYWWARASGTVRPALLEPTFTQLTDQAGIDSFPSLSPDGGLFAFVHETSPGNQDIYLQRIGGSNPIDLTADSSQDDTQPAFSPDGRQIAFRSGRDGGGIFVMGATGESARRLTDFGFEPAWSPDGREIAFATDDVQDPRSRSTRSQIWLVDVPAGHKRLLQVEGDAVQPSWSPHRLRIAYWGVSTAGARRVIWTAPVRGGKAVPVTQDSFVNWSPTWSPDGGYLYFSSDRGGSMSLWRVRIDETTGEVQGDPEPIITPAPWSSGLRFSQDGKRAIYGTRYSKANLERAGLDPATLTLTQPLQPITQGSREVVTCRVSPNGRWIAFSSKSPQEDLFLVGTDGSGLRQLTNDAFKDRYPTWSFDGSRILFYSNRSGRYEAWSIRPDGSDLQPLTRTQGEEVIAPLWSPDSRRLVCGIGFTGPALIDLTRPIAERAPERLPPSPTGRPFFASSWSPDGTWLAGNSKGDLFLYSLASRRYERLQPGGGQPVWFHDGLRLLYSAASGGQVHVFDLRTRQSRQLLVPPASSSFRSADLGPDDRTLYVVRSQEEGNICMLTMK